MNRSHTTLRSWLVIQSMGISGSNTWRYVSTICLAIVCGDIPWNIGRIYGRYLWFRFLKWPLTHCGQEVCPTRKFDVWFSTVFPTVLAIFNWGISNFWTTPLISSYIPPYIPMEIVVVFQKSAFIQANLPRCPMKDAEPHHTLLWFLRERLGLTGGLGGSWNILKQLP